MIQIDSIDHIVLTVHDLEATLHFYAQILGLEVIMFGEGRYALQCGQQKINLHVAGAEFEPKAHCPQPGSADLCLITSQPLDQVIDALKEWMISGLEGPVARTGARGAIQSIYIRDPDRNLIEISNYL